MQYLKMLENGHVKVLRDGGGILYLMKIGRRQLAHDFRKVGAVAAAIVAVKLEMFHSSRRIDGEY